MLKEKWGRARNDLEDNKKGNLFYVVELSLVVKPILVVKLNFVVKLILVVKLNFVVELIFVVKLNFVVVF